VTPTCPYAFTVGSFVLGVLHERESEEFRRHADECLHCKQEIAELAPTARLLKTFKAQLRAVDEPHSRPVRLVSPAAAPHRYQRGDPWPLW